MRSDPSIVVVGAGAWGTALAVAAHRAGRRVTLCGRKAPAMATMQASRAHPSLPGLALADDIAVVADTSVVARADIVLLAVPAQQTRAACRTLAPSLETGTPVVTCAKGLERNTDAFMTDIIADELPQAVPAVLSGPSFAADVAAGLPTAVTVATRDVATARTLAQALGSPTFRPYHATDLRGVEIGGAVKNVLAIAAGIVTGRDLGASALAALTTRGFSEMMRFGAAHGARPETLAGLSGLGDLLLSCASPQSRNHALGIALGRSEMPPASLAEGAWTAPVLCAMARAMGVEMPVAEAVRGVLAGDHSIDAAIEQLLARPFRAEV